MATPAETHAADKAILEGKKYISEKLQTYLSQITLQTHLAGFQALSPREHDVLYYLLEGLIVKQISDQLRMKQSTVSTYKERIMNKLEAENMVDLYKKMHWFIQ
ncbi:regulatory protein, luxR family [Dyadobacter soli]|uniref:Regulatory protein, luxR family n=1 Tax=Dyadobacter soli TaxID=659014 RepID=A0A1G8CJC7_9BACT|nr:LuxR C-terminal-related transcriptional regulator [Dyadobacter soli]SDH45449.1 regulatory protein, luxR family [Dyadobacter soli]